MAMGIESQQPWLRDDVLKAARTLSIDRVTAEVVSAFDAAGIASILLKGPSIARWLYPEGGRSYCDSDLLVPPGELDHAKAVLGGLGFVGAQDAWSRFEVPIENHASTFVRGGAGHRNPGTIDLHHTMGPIPTPDDKVWEVFCTHRLPLLVGGVEVQVLDRIGVALQIVLHALHHGGGSHTLEDLRRLVDTLPPGDWPEVARLAATLGVEEALALGLRLNPAGAQIAGRLGLADRSVETTMWWGSFAPRGARSLSIVAASRTTREKLGVTWWTIFPSRARITSMSGGIPRGRPWALAGAYCAHWSRVAKRSVPALRYLVANKVVMRRFPAGSRRLASFRRRFEQ